MSSLGRKLLRLGCFVSLLALALVVWVVLPELRAARLPTTSAFHPFRSAELRQEFLARYDARAEDWPVPFEERTVETSWGPTFVRISGRPTAPPLLLLHGIGGNGFQWLDNVEFLAGHFRVYAVDHVQDFGRSVWRRPLSDRRDHLAWLDEVLETLEPERPWHLMGMSYGGWLAARYALEHQERVASLLLLAPVATVEPLAGEWMVRAVLCALPYRGFTRSFMGWLAEDLEASPGGEERLDRMADEAYFALHAFRPRPVLPPDVFSDEELRALPARTLVLVGENEKIYDPQLVISRLHAVAPHIRALLLPDAGHDLSLVQAERVHREVKAFLSSSGAWPEEAASEAMGEEDPAASAKVRPESEIP